MANKIIIKNIQPAFTLEALAEVRDVLEQPDLSTVSTDLNIELSEALTETQRQTLMNHLNKGFIDFALE